MIIKNEFFFSPYFLLKDLNPNNVIDAFKDRIEKWYFYPIEIMNKEELGFAATALMASVIDILAKTSNYDTSNSKNKEKYTKWTKENLQFTEEEVNNFYDHFRCGLLHSGCVESGGYVNYKETHFCKKYGKSLIINPKLLFEKLKKVFDKLIEDEDPKQLLKYLEGKLDDTD